MTKEERLTLWQRNVVDEFKELPNEEIQKILQSRAHPFAALFCNVLGDFNMSTGIRNANGFNAREVFYYGQRHWDRRGACGVHNYTQVKRLKTLEEVVVLKDIYTFVGVDNLPGAVKMEDYQYSMEKPVLFLFGEEGSGLAPEIQQLCEVMIEISMYGSVRSFNVGTSSGIVMYDFVNKVRRYERNLR